MGIRHYHPPTGPGEGLSARSTGYLVRTELATYRGTNPYLEKRWDRLALFLPGDAPSATVICGVL